MDLPWTAVGLEGLIEERAFRVLSIEVDASWGGRAVQGCWNVSLVDQLAWFARRHGYASYLKVPCDAHLPHDGRMLEPAYSAWYYRLAAPSTAFVPSGVHPRDGNRVMSAHQACSPRQRSSHQAIRQSGNQAAPSTAFVPSGVHALEGGGLRRTIQDMLLVDSREDLRRLEILGAKSCVRVEGTPLVRRLDSGERSVRRRTDEPTRCDARSEAFARFEAMSAAPNGPNHC